MCKNIFSHDAKPVRTIYDTEFSLKKKLAIFQQHYHRRVRLIDGNSRSIIASKLGVLTALAGHATRSVLVVIFSIYFFYCEIQFNCIDVAICDRDCI